MNVSMKKVKVLWKRFKAENAAEDSLKKLHLDEAAIVYAQQLFRNLDDIWGYNLPPPLKDSQATAWASDCAVGIDAGGADAVYKRLIEKSQALGLDDERLRCRDLVWGKLSGIKSDRVAHYRISSNASGFSKFETYNTTCCMMNPDPWVFSYNFPWHVIGWMKDVRACKTPTYQLVYDNHREDVLDKRFVYKYLWMISCEQVVPVLSLRSFLNLRPFFAEVWAAKNGGDKGAFDKAFGIGGGRWVQGFDDFKSKWHEFTATLLDQLGVPLDGIAEWRIKIGKFLFALSLTEEGSQDLGTLLEKGNKSVILYGPPGTGKTYTALEYVFGVLGVDREQAEKCRHEEDGRVYYTSPSDSGEVTIVQFHPNYSYQDFVGGIFPGVDKDDKTKLFYETKAGVFKKICDTAKKPENAGKKYYLLIDEINRADLSSVFGELMYGLEYRGFAMSVPTFGEFVIPENVYLIGTMNNTDKSLVGFDLALRRRFAFLRVPPNMDVLANFPFVAETNSADSDGADVASLYAKRAENLNKSLHAAPFSLPSEKEIGHAYFLRIKDFCDYVEVDGKKCYTLTSYALEQLWIYHIRPLLEEYIGLEFDEREDDVKRIMNAFCAEFT